MKLRLPHKFQTALMAALASVSITTLSSATAYAQDTAAAKSDGELGLTLFMGDSITNGVKDMTYRWQLFKTFVDNGVYFSLDGPISGYDASWLPSSTTNPDYGTAYRGIGFVNNHYGRSSGRSGEMISGDRYGYKVADVGNTYDIHTGTLLIGTNDLLSDTSSGAAYSAYAGKMQGLMGGTVTYSADKDPNATWTWTQGSTMGNLGTIIDSMNLETGENFYVLSVPAWGPHKNHTSSADHAAVRAYNTLLQEWVAAYDAQTDANVKYVEVNTGLVDMTSSTAFFGNKAFFNNGADGLHPSQQGSLIMAGNVARAMGIGGRTAGLSRSAATGDGWSSSATPITFQPEDAAQTFASGEFSVENGYTVDFTATFGNGSAGGWLDPDKDNNNSVASLSSFSTLTNSLNIQVGDGTHTGTLKLAEGYVAWSADNGDMVLYCQDNSVSGNEALRIAYRDADTANNILGGYYVWKGDMLIGQGLAAVNGSLNGISLSITGNASTGGSINNLSWANTAYAPSTELFSLEPLPSHDNEKRSTLGIDFSTDSTSYTGQYATGANAAKVVQTSVTSTNWFAPVGANHSGGVAVEYKGIAGPKNNMFGIVVSSGSITESGNVSVVIDGGSTLNGGDYDSSGAFSIIGSFQGTITQKLSIEIDEATLSHGVLMGVVKGTNSIGGVDLRINSGATIGGDVIGGNHSASGTIAGDVDITITGGSIAGSVYGGNMDRGTISGNTNVTITGGVISGGVFGGNKTGGTIGGTTSVVVDGILPYIGGDIVADTVTLQNVAPESEHADTFDKYRGRIRAASTLVLNKYTVEHLLASVETQSLVLQGNSKTTVGNLTLTACAISVEAGSELTLEGVNTYGNTTTYSGHVAIADYTTFTLHTATMSGEASGYSDGDNGYAKGTMIVLNPLTEGESLYTTSGDVLTDTNAATFIGGGILSGATFKYDATTGQLTAEAQGSGGPYFVNQGTVAYGSSSTESHAYEADDIRLNGGTLQFQEELKAGTALSVTKAGSGISLDKGVSLNASAITYGQNVSGFALSGQGELILTAANAEQILTTVTGDGTMHLVESAVLNGVGATAANPKASVSTGTLIVGNGAGSDQVQLQIGRTTTGGNYVANYATIKSFQHVTLDNGQLWFHTNNDNSALTVNGLTVTENGGSIYLQDVNAASTITLAGTTNLQGNLTYTNNWKDNTLDVEKLTGSGDFSVAVNNNSLTLNLHDVSGWSGTMDLATGGGKTHVIQGDSSLMSFRQGSGTGTYNFGTQNSTANFNGLTFEGTSAQVNIFTTSAAKNIHTNKLTLGSGMTLTAYYGQYVTAEGLTTKLVADTLQLLGDATIKTSYHGGYMEFGSITGSGTLTIQHTAGSTIRDTVSVGGNPDVDSATFTGKLLINEDNAGAGRGIFVVLNDKLTMSQAQLELKAQATSTSARYMGVGINADLVQLGGLSEDGYVSSLTAYTLFSGDASGSADAKTYSGYGSRGGMRTLEITGAGGSTSIKVLNNISLAMSGTGTQTFTGDMSQFNGSINVTNGTLALTPNSSIATHAVEVGSNGTLSIATTGNNSITAFGTMVNEGKLTLSGTVALNSSDLSAYTMVEGSGSQTTYSGKNTYAGSGFLVSSAEYYLVKGNGTVSGTYNIDETTGSLVEGKTTGGNVVVTFKPNETGGLYYVNDDFTYDATEMGNATGFVIAKDATLTTNSVSDVTNKVLHGSGSYAALNRSDNGPWSAANGYGLGAGVSLGTDWTGTVVVSGGAGNKQMMNLDILGNNGHATVEIKGLVGWSQNWNGTIAANIKLTDDGSTVAWSNGASTSGSATATFTGRWSGAGTFKRTGNNNVNYTYIGDISEWVGKFDMNGGNTTLTFAGSANAVNATIVKTGGTLGVVVDTDATFSKAITANTFTVNAGKTATLAPAANDATYNVGSITNNGTIAVAAGKAASFTASGNLNFGNIIMDNGATLNFNHGAEGREHTFSSIALTDGATATINIINNSWCARFNIGTLTGAADTTLNLWTGAKVNKATVYDMNGGEGSAFYGNVVVSQQQTAGARYIAMNINSGAAEQLQNSVVTLSSNASCENPQVGLGINADSVVVKGIVSDPNATSGTHYIFSGAALRTTTSFDNFGDGEDRTLTINTGDSAEAEYSTRAKVGSHLSIVKEGSGTQTFSGDMSAFNGSLTVNNGTLAITGSNGVSAAYITSDTSDGTLDVTGVLTLTGVQDSFDQYTYAGKLAVGGLHVDGGFHEIHGIDRLGSAIQVGDLGVLALGAGTYNLSGLAIVPGEVPTPTASGYDKTYSGTVQFATGYIAPGNNLVFTHGEHTSGTLNADTGVVTFEDYDYTTYHVRDNRTYSDAEMGRAQYLQIDQGQVLTAGEAPSTAKVLKGTGTYALASGDHALAGTVTYGGEGEWGGITRISGYKGNNRLDTVIAALDTTAAAKVELNDITGLFGGSKNALTIAADIILTGNGEGGTGTALEITQGYSGDGAERTFSGTVEGHGDFLHSWGNGGYQGYTFTNDISQWDGAFKTTGNATAAMSLTYTGGATVVNSSISHARASALTVNITNSNAVTMNGDITRSNGTLNVNVSADTTFKGELEGITKLTVNDGKSATVEGGMVLNNGATTLDGAGALSVTGVVSGTGSITKAGTGTVTLSAANTYSGATTVSAGTLQFNQGFNFGSTVSGAGNITYGGSANGTLNFGGNDISAWTGSFNNTGSAVATLNITKNNGHVKAAIGNEQGGTINITSANDVFFDNVVNINDITHNVNHTLYVGTDSALGLAGEMTVTGHASTGRLVVGNNTTDSAAVFTLSGENARLSNGNDHTYGAKVQGYGTFAVVDGAYETLTGDLVNGPGPGFHGTFAADGAGSILTLNTTFASDVTLKATNGGVIKLTQSYTMGDNTAVDGGTLAVSSGLVVNGTVDLSKGTLTQTGGTVTVNADKSLTLGNASITSAITNNGAVTFTKDITATGLAKEGEDVSYRVGADDNKSTNGNYFFQGERTESTLRVVTGGTVNPAGHTVTQDEVAYALKADGTATGVTADSVDYSIFYQAQAGTTVSVSQLADTAAKHDTELAAVYSIGAWQNPTVLDIDQNLGTAIVGFGTVNIGSGFDYTGDLLIYGGMNTVNGQLDIAQVGFYAAQDSVTVFTDAPVVDGGVRFTSDAELGGVQVQASKVSDSDDNYYGYDIGDSHYAVLASELSKEGGEDATVRNSLMVNRVHNSAENASGKLTLDSGVVAASLKEVTATSGDVEFLNMAAANATPADSQTQVYLNTLEIGEGKTVSFYEGSIDQAAKEASVTVNGTLTAGSGAHLNSDLNMASGSTLDVNGAQDMKGLIMGSKVTLNSGSTLDVTLGTGDTATDRLYNYLTSGHEFYYLFDSVEALTINDQDYDKIEFNGWDKPFMDASTIYSNLNSQTFYVTYNGTNVGTYTLAIGLVPEPTTSTLSLLALCALAARRRRK